MEREGKEVNAKEGAVEGDLALAFDDDAAATASDVM